MELDPALLQRLAGAVGTPFWLYDAATLRQRIADIRFLAEGSGVQPRFAMKACPAGKVLREMREMRYLWQVPLRLDNRKLVALLGREPHTPLDQAIRTSLVALGCIEQNDKVMPVNSRAA